MMNIDQQILTSELKPLDGKTYFQTLADFLTELPRRERFIGMKFTVVEGPNGKPIVYWFKDGTNNTDAVPYLGEIENKISGIMTVVDSHDILLNQIQETIETLPITYHTIEEKSGNESPNIIFENIDDHILNKSEVYVNGVLQLADDFTIAYNKTTKKVDILFLFSVGLDDVVSYKYYKHYKD